MFLYLTLSGRRSDPIITLRKLHMMTMTRKCILLSITDPEETEQSLNPDATCGCLNNSRPHSNYYDWSSSAFRSTSQSNNKKTNKNNNLADDIITEK